MGAMSMSMPSDLSSRAKVGESRRRPPLVAASPSSLAVNGKQVARLGLIWHLCARRSGTADPLPTLSRA